MDERKAKVYELCEGMYSIMCDAVKPHDKERWMEKVWNNLKDKPQQTFDWWIEITQGVLDCKDDDEVM